MEMSALEAPLPDGKPAEDKVCNSSAAVLQAVELEALGRYCLQLGLMQWGPLLDDPLA